MKNLKENSNLGLHLRWDDSIFEVLDKAQKLNLNYFQCFLFNRNFKYTRINQNLIENFNLAKDQYKKIFVHASFGINFADPNKKSHLILEKELNIARELSFNYYVLHPGAVPKKFKKADGIKAIANLINIYSKEFPNITFILENTAHKGRSIGGDLVELKEILELIENKDKVKICIDTAHAFVYGYNLNSKTGIENFINKIKALFNQENIELIHLNNSKEKLASQCDCHSLVSEGKIDLKYFNYFLKDKFFKNTIKILELPLLKEEVMIKELLKVKNLSFNLTL